MWSGQGLAMRSVTGLHCAPDCCHTHRAYTAAHKIITLHRNTHIHTHTHTGPLEQLAKQGVYTDTHTPTHTHTHTDAVSHPHTHTGLCTRVHTPQLCAHSVLSVLSLPVVNQFEALTTVRNPSYTHTHTHTHMHK